MRLPLIIYQQSIYTIFKNISCISSLFRKANPKTKDNNIIISNDILLTDLPPLPNIVNIRKNNTKIVSFIK